MKNELSDLEKQILGAAGDGIRKAIGDALTGYNSLLTKFATEVINNNAVEIKNIMSEAFSKVVSTKEFREDIMAAFQHKVAKMLVGNLEGSVQKAVDALRGDATIRARMILAIEEIVKDNLPKK